VKDLSGTASELVSAPLEQCLALVQAVDRYPEWYPEVVRSVEVVQRDPQDVPVKARTNLHVGIGPVAKNFDLVFAIVAEPPGTVKLTKVTDEPSERRFDVTWELTAGARTRITVKLHARLDVPRFLPLAGVGDTLARGFVTAASRELEHR
jgi:ribosome-associated toxin RatA of RatAB toxin-antitoxin module